MRIIKLSTKEFSDIEDVKSFFKYLHSRKIRGKFRIPKGWIAENGLHDGEMLLFPYLTKVYYVAKSASGRLLNSDKYRDTHPFYFVVDLDTLHHAKISLHYVEKQLMQNGAAKKSIVRSRGWPKIQDSPFTEKLWKSLIDIT